MFQDLNKDEDSRETLKGNKKRILKIADKLEKVSNEDTGIASMLIMSDEETAFVHTQGSAKLLRKALVSACGDSDDFSTLILEVATAVSKRASKNFTGSVPPSDLEKEIRDQVEKRGMASFDTPKGLGLAIDPEKMDSLSEEDMDQIIDEMLKNSGLDKLRGEDDDTE